MKKFLITRCDVNPDSVGRPNGIQVGRDTLEEAEEYIKLQGSAYNYQIFEGVCCYTKHVELRKTPMFDIST